MSKLPSRPFAIVSEQPNDRIFATIMSTHRTLGAAVRALFAMSPLERAYIIDLKVQVNAADKIDLLTARALRSANQTAYRAL
jgi:hypothetical protein